MNGRMMGRGLAAAVLAVGFGVAGIGAAGAAPQSHHRDHGVSATVTSWIELNVRQHPWTGSQVVWSLEPGSHVKLACEQEGWYRLADGSGWVDARYVHPHEWVRYC
ncbi:SH3 domain-containing protein [Streptomyces sp. NPDC058613]|uniref:SH3 domain-containing protein n=1 Tax=Streptomyces sp. NPDC058613 TaxID=3346556 RepID=UPI00364C0A67